MVSLLKEELSVNLKRTIHKSKTIPMFKKCAIGLVKKWPRIHKLSKILRGHPIITVDYPLNPVPRYGYGHPPHHLLYEIINKKRNTYRKILEKSLQFKEYFLDISVSRPHNQEPCWINGWFSGVDPVGLYTFLCLNSPERFYEIGSGWSTRFARRAIRDHNLSTKITSFDPSPRADIDAICNTIVRDAIENVDVTLFGELEPGDILFVDSSHCCYMNSDVSVIFLDILPQLKAGVFVEFHDIFLPYDYPPWWKEYYYSEQYLLAAMILAGSACDIVLPNTFVSNDPELSSILDPLWNEPAMKGVPHHGRSFWIQMK